SRDLHSFPTRRSSDLTAGRARILDQRPDDALRLLRLVQRVAMAGPHLEHRPHQARPAVLAGVVARVDTAGVWRALLSPNGSLGRSEEHTSELQSRENL